METQTPKPTFSLVIPVCNQREQLERLYYQLVDEVARLGESYELIFVDDGSTDGSEGVLRELQAGDRHVRLVLLSRAFGTASAVTAGCNMARGRAVITFDQLCEDWPKLMSSLISQWREGQEVVHVNAQGRGREKGRSARRAVVELVLRTTTTAAHADMRLIDAKVISALGAPGLPASSVDQQIAMIGFRQNWLPRKGKVLVRRRRVAVADGRKPGRLFWWMLSGGVGLLGFSLLFYLVSSVLLLFGVQTGYETRLTSLVIALAGLQLGVLALMGRFAAAAVAQIDRQPLYVVREVVGSAEPAPMPEEPGEVAGEMGSYVVYT
jgi:dolichol-phosphate mannosyltransferase